MIFTYQSNSFQKNYHLVFGPFFVEFVLNCVEFLEKYVEFFNFRVEFLKKMWNSCGTRKFLRKLNMDY